MNGVTIRIARPTDAEKLLSIYAPYVLETAITFEYDVPTVEEFAGRIENTLKRYPYFVAESDGEIAGYAYASPFKERAAYDRAVETTVYVKKSLKRSGIGKRLYEALENALRLQNIINANACIAYPVDDEDEYLTKNSVGFHEHMGYRLVGEFIKCGYKFDRWYNMVWMEKFLSRHTDRPKKVIPFNDIREKLYKEYGIC